MALLFFFFWPPSLFFLFFAQKLSLSILFRLSLQTLSRYLFWYLTKARLAHATTMKAAANPAPIPSWPHAVAPSML